LKSGSFTLLENLWACNRSVEGLPYLYVVIIDTDTFSHNTQLKSVAKYVNCVMPIIFNREIAFYFDNNTKPINSSVLNLQAGDM
jgi:hypothetical protein